MNNFDKIKNMTKDELAEFINNLIDGGIEKAECSVWFNEKYCKICPDIEVKYDGKKQLWKECYFESKCPHQDWGVGLIKLWLDGESD